MGVISTIEAKCKDCYKCLRSCPVKAIRIKPVAGSGDLAAQVVDELCIMDGTCVRQCPQNAKRVRDEVGAARVLLSGKAPVVASVAPSFVAGLPLGRPLSIVTALKALGFAYVQETAIGASLVAREHRRRAGSGSGAVISTACPVAVNLVERYYPEAISMMVPIVSPMIAHAKFIRERYPGARVVFIGPCFGKKGEAEDDGHEHVQAVLTFAEVWRWFKEEGIDPETMPETPFDGPDPDIARVFPVDGGLAYTAAFETGVVSKGVAIISGLEDCMEFLKAAVSKSLTLEGVAVVELLACRGGCINGPGMLSDLDLYTRKMQVLRYVESQRRAVKAGALPVDEESAALDRAALSRVNLTRTFLDRRASLKHPSEEELRDILARTGKLTPEDELNCGACGYGSCREKAVAVYNGLADIQMCMPYMRSRAESMSNSVVEHSPNGVLVVDREGRIVEVNAAFERMFSCKAAAVRGKPLSTIIEPDNYLAVIKEKKALRVPVSYPQYGIVTEQTIFYIPGQDVAVGLIEDVTEAEKRRDEMLRLKSATMKRAQEVINKQMKVAQEIAGLLGETTAETKVLLSKIIELSRHD